MDWETIKYFKAEEFPKNEVELTDPRLFRTLETFREDLGFPVYPSPTKGALARKYGEPRSRHYAIGKLSTAVDFFPECDLVRAWLMAIHYFGGVGLYFDTCYRNRKWAMIHGDLRQNQRLWYRENGIYHLVDTKQKINYLIERLKHG